MKLYANGLIEKLEPDDLVGKYFWFKEFCKRAPVPEEHYDRLLRLCMLLDRLRVFADCPLIITSGYRSPAHNATVAGAAKVSQHSWMRAVDLRPANSVHYETANQKVSAMVRWLLDNADELGVGGLGRYPAQTGRPRARLHVDQRPRLPGIPVTTWQA